MKISSSYPYLSIARQFGLPYETVLALATNSGVTDSQRVLQHKVMEATLPQQRWFSFWQAMKEAHRFFIQVRRTGVMPS